jgi:type II secretory pathway predicted ATPase ExeA
MRVFVTVSNKKNATGVTGMHLDQYGLTAQPFQLTPDARFWFESATHKQAMAYLGYGLQQGEGFIVITGEIGAGKTTLVGHLIGLLDPARANAVHLVSTQLGRDDLLHAVAQGLGLSVSGLGKADVLAQIQAFLSEGAKAGKRTLLFVDEAQNLPVESLEELRMLSNFQNAATPMIQILLLGQPEFRTMLNTPALEQLNQRVIASHHLTGMDVEEVAAYLNHRMAIVGWHGRPHFLTDAVTSIHEATNGIPRLINHVAARALLLAGLEQSDKIDAQTIAMVEAELAHEAPREIEKELATLIAAGPAGLDAAARLAMLEAQVSEQDAALRRVLSILVNWIEAEPGLVSKPTLVSAPAA